MEIERCPQRFAGLVDGCAQRDQLFADARVERVGVGPVDLDEVAGGVAEVHLCRPVRQFVHPREERVVVAKALLTGAPVDGVEVIDVQAHVMELRRLGVGADE